MSKCKLGDVLKIKHGYAFKSENYVKSSQYRLITLGNFAEGNSFKYNDEKATYYGSDFPSEFILREGDLIMPLTEQVIGLFGNTAFIPKTEGYTFVLNQRVGKVIYNEKKVNKYYLHYLLATNSVKQQIEARASGTRQRNISPENIYDVEVDIPELSIQKKIGSLLYSIEEKQINNRNIIDKLDFMAKTLYDYWFLQFEFPNEEGKPYKHSGGKMVWNEELKREIPEGWEVTRVDDIIKTAPKIKSIKAPDYLSKGEFPIVDQAEGLITGYTNSSELVYKNENGCVVFGDVTKYFKFINFPFAKGTDGTKIMESKNNRIPSLLLYQLLKDAKLPNIGFARHYMYLRDFRFVLPSEHICKMYEATTKEMMQRRANIIKENQELAALRDFLLPLLMNGQVGFKEET